MTDKKRKLTKADGEAVNDAASGLIAAIRGEHPLLSVIGLYRHAPEPVQAYLENKLTEMIALAMPKLMLLMEHGIVLDRDSAEFEPVAETFQASCDVMPAKLRSKISKTAEDAGFQIGEAIDTAMRRILLEDTTLNHEAYLDILSAHAQIVRSLEGLIEVPSAEDVERANAALAEAREALVGISTPSEDKPGIVH